jgi:reactive intermediate/imine deaminase
MMKRILLIPALLMMAVTVFSQTKHTIVELVNPASVAAPKGYSQAAVVDLGNCKMVIMSGQVPLDKDGQLVGKGDVGKQARQVFQNIKNIVEEMGGSMQDVVKLTYLITDIASLAKVREARDAFINTQKPPASTLAQVNKLYREDVLIEVEATAVIAKKISAGDQH